MIKLDKYFKKIPSFEIVPPTNNSNSIINETISSSNSSHDFNLIMDETLTPSLSKASIILDIGAQMFRKHINNEIILARFENLKKLLENDEVKKKCYGSKESRTGLLFYWDIHSKEIPENLKYLDNLDISKCNALIRNVFENKEQKIFKYCDIKSKYVRELTNIRNKLFGHMLFFETDDLRFSITVVILEEIIRQLCKYDPSVSKDFLDRIETVLDRDSFQDRDKEEIIKKLENSNDEMMKSFSKKLVEFQKSNTNNFINIQQFEELINEMKSTEESRKILLEIVSSTNSNVSKTLEIVSSTGSKVSKILEGQDEIKSDVSKICPKIDELKKMLNGI